MARKRTGEDEVRLVVGYIRVSSSQQALDGESLERQEAQIRAYCTLKGLGEPVIISDAGLSGFKSNRPGFQKVVAMCERREVSRVIVYDLSRLSRSVRGTLAFIEDVVQRHGVEFVSLMNDIDTSTPAGKAFLGISAIFNQLYRDEIAHKTTLALRHKRSKGEKTGGTLPYGFRLGDGGLLVEIQVEHEAIALIQSLRQSGLSLRRIAEELKARGVPTKTGKTSWAPRVVLDILQRKSVAHPDPIRESSL